MHLIIFLFLFLITCSKRRHKRRRLHSKQGDEERGTSSLPVEVTSHSAFSPYPVPSPPGQLPGLHHNANQHTSLPAPSPSGAGSTAAHQLVPIQLQQIHHSQIPVARTTALTMSEAGDLAAAQLQKEEEEEDEEGSISVELSHISSSPDSTSFPSAHYTSPSPAQSSRHAQYGSIPPSCFYPISSSPQSSSCCACCCHSHHQCYALPLPPTPPFTPPHRSPSPIPDPRRLPHWPYPHQTSKPRLPQPLSCPPSPLQTTHKSSLHTRSKSSTPTCQRHLHNIMTVPSQTHAKSVSELATAV